MVLKNLHQETFLKASNIFKTFFSVRYFNTRMKLVVTRMSPGLFGSTTASGSTTDVGSTTSAPFLEWQSAETFVDIGTADQSSICAVNILI